jgi:hypothetical protein
MKAEGENNMSQQLTNKQQARRTEVHICVCITTTLNKQQTLFSVW